MSSFIKKAKHPITGKMQDAIFIDKGSHYEVAFRQDGKDFKIGKCGYKYDVFNEEKLKS